MDRRNKRMIFFKRGEDCLGLVPESGDWAFWGKSIPLPLTTHKIRQKRLQQGNALELVLYIGNRCNFSCKYCYSHYFRNMTTSQSMSLETCKRALRNAVNLDYEDINVFFFGAEPFLERKLIVDTIKFLRSNKYFGRNFYFHTTTNGSLIREDDVTWIKKYNVNVGVSFDGPPHIHNRNRVYHNGKGTYDQVMRGIKILSNSGAGPSGVLITVYDPRLLFETCKFIIEEKISSSVKIRPLYLEGKTSINRYLKGGVDKYAEKLAGEHLKVADLLAENNQKKGSFKVVCENLKSIILNMVCDERPNYCMRSPCGANGDILTVNQDGAVVTCDKVFNFPELGIICNLNESESDMLLRRALKDVKLVSKLSKRTVENIQNCKKCFYRRYCGGGCALESYLKFGSLQREDVFCKYYKIMFEELLWKTAKDPAYSVMLTFPEQVVA